MRNYLDLMEEIINDGIYRPDRTNTGTVSVFGRQLRFDLANGFPLVTTKKILVDKIIHELLWFLSGSTNIKPLNDNGVHIWDAWANWIGDLGPIYGAQWTCCDNYRGGDINQIFDVIESIKNNPESRRHIVSAWNVGMIKDMELPPCHILFQFYVAEKKLSCQLYQRSCDLFLGAPWNIASYALLTHMIAQQCNLGVGEFIWTLGDVHLYINHLKQAKEQIKRIPYILPELIINNKPNSIFDYSINDFEFVDYKHHPFLKAPIAI